MLVNVGPPNVYSAGSIYSQGILGLGFVEINIKCVGIEMKEKKTRTGLR